MIKHIVDNDSLGETDDDEKLDHWGQVFIDCL